MRYNAVSICVGYADFLAWTLPTWRTVFDRTIIVTRPSDEETIRVCDYNYVECIQTEAFGGPNEFKKGAGINVGLAKLAPGAEDWVIHLDSDIALPPQTSRFLRQKKLDPACIYGVDRLMCRSFQDWIQHLSNGFPQHQNNYMCHLGHWPTYARLVGYGGYWPIGFFQMWHPWYTGHFKYPEGHTTAAREDSKFALQWKPEFRHLIGDFVGIHLEPCATAQGSNWVGRTTPKFGY